MSVINILGHLEEIRNELKNISHLSEGSLKWTSKVPTIPGTYWVFSKRTAFKQIAFVMAGKFSNNPFITTTTGAVIRYDDKTMRLPDGVLMCGPLYEPEDPTDKDYEQVEDEVNA